MSKQLDQTALDLLKTAQLLRDEGWVQGAFGSRGYPKCASRALNIVTDWDFGRYMEAYMRLGNYIDKQYGRCVGGLLVWNDMPGRTADEVIGTIKRAATA